MRSLMAQIVTLVFGAMAFLGCDKKHEVVVYEPALRMDQLAPGLSAPHDNFTLLTDQRTEGRFTCPLAIAKFVPGAATDGGGLRFVAMHHAEEAAWAEQFRGVLALRFILFMRPMDTRPEGQSTQELCNAALRLGAPLLLVYAPNGTGPNSAQVLGVLYDTSNEQPLATLHATAKFLEEDGIEASPNRARGDHRTTDARFQAQRTFEQHTLTCLRELIHLDSPATTTQPNKWQTSLFDRWWVHYR